MRNVTAALLLVLSFNLFAFPLTPDSYYSPGVFCTPKDVDFKEYRYGERIAYCQRNVSFDKREQVCERDGVHDRHNYKVDHIIPLNLGGSNSSKNLWCQHLSIDTEQLEFKIYEKVKAGIMKRDDGVAIILRCKFDRICN